LIETQKSLFNNLKINFNNDSSDGIKTAGAAALKVEDIIIRLKDTGQSPTMIRSALETIDSENAIYNAIRTFAVIVNLIEKKLTDEEDFTEQERLEYYEILINYTDFSLFKLILISVKYLNNAQTERMESNYEFVRTIEYVGAGDYYRDI
jgi:hypothetical protein